MPMIVQRRAIDIVIDELKMVFLEGAAPKSASNEAKYRAAPPLSASIGMSQAARVTTSATAPAQICLGAARRMESSHSGPRNRIEDCLQPAAIPSMIALATRNLPSPE